MTDALNGARRARYQAHRVASRCARCAKALASLGKAAQFATCASCRRAARELRRDVRERWRDAGACTGCGGRRDKGPGVFRCLSCYEAGKKRVRALGHNPKRVSRYMRKLRRRRRLEGVCAYCGRTREDERFKMCANCRERARVAAAS